MEQCHQKLKYLILVNLCSILKFFINAQNTSRNKIVLSVFEIGTFQAIVMCYAYILSTIKDREIISKSNFLLFLPSTKSFFT